MTPDIECTTAKTIPNCSMIFKTNNSSDLFLFIVRFIVATLKTCTLEYIKKKNKKKTYKYIWEDLP